MEKTESIHISTVKLPYKLLEIIKKYVILHRIEKVLVMEKGY